MNKIGIIGQGFVGSAVREKFREDFKVYAYDKYNSSVSLVYDKETESGPENLISDLVQECKIIFVCVPTPMFPDGECDTRIVESIIDELAIECESKNKSITAIVKSTVPPGTIELLNKKSSRIEVMFSPEFLTEANAISDFKNQGRIVLGIDKLEYQEPVVNLFKKSFPNANIIVIRSKEAEMVKYTTNLFLATKVSFFNDIYSICERLKIDYNYVIDATLQDPRIGKSHYKVPGPDGDRGFGGHCFPKDISAILWISQELGLSIPTIMGAYVTNQIVRKDRDWEEMTGRAVSERETGLEINQ
jgi:UDPglucose 6-dehydrogenase